ncbi:aspartate/glutamate racemase family protein [Parachitinimonas caeni]|uniref:Aspartate/glutamate racemase family protein n=1 Tax=Parachitinimonas caeni TaxID=3031301 RepID=A0ABT7DRN3_9NEIS|nr:aspartate/glutamate racemase family protein [Parachitinimonas caeni]MDK2122733.1 aspartate/glutamate racemase family protein [Parachitinimonas caeni]
METMGLLGGMSWESTAGYYRLINQAIRQRLGGLHSAKLVMHSVDFHEIEQLQAKGDWDEAGRQLALAARSVEAAGADFIILCTNTMHKVAPAIEAAVSIPLLHIVEPTAAAIREAGIKKVGLLGTRFTMEQPFYKGRLSERHGIEVLTPDDADREVVHRIIYQELCLGQVKDDSREAYRRIIKQLVADGAEGIIFGCTEISMLVGAADSPVPTFDTTELHALAAADAAIRYR